VSAPVLGRLDDGWDHCASRDCSAKKTYVLSNECILSDLEVAVRSVARRRVLQRSLPSVQERSMSGSNASGKASSVRGGTAGQTRTCEYCSSGVCQPIHLQIKVSHVLGTIKSVDRGVRRVACSTHAGCVDKRKSCVDAQPEEQAVINTQGKAVCCTSAPHWRFSGTCPMWCTEAKHVLWRMRRVCPRGT